MDTRKPRRLNPVWFGSSEVTVLQQGSDSVASSPAQTAPTHAKLSFCCCAGRVVFLLGKWKIQYTDRLMFNSSPLWTACKTKRWEKKMRWPKQKAVDQIIVWWARLRIYLKKMTCTWKQNLAQRWSIKLLKSEKAFYVACDSCLG